MPTTRSTARTGPDERGAVGGALRPAISIADDLARPVRALIERMAKEIKREMVAVLKDAGLTGYTADAADGSIQARVQLNKLEAKWSPRFNRLAKRAVDQMVARTVKNSAVTLGMSLRDISEGFKIDTAIMDERIRQVISASTQEAVNLIKLIPQQYIADVQGAVMRSITTGRGVRDLVPFLNQHYDGRIRWARNVAMDQVRKTYSNVNAARLQAIGVESFQWVHTGGGMHPRKDHIAMSGKEYRYDDLPVIGVMYGKEVRGKPGDLPFCRCIMKPVLNWK